MSGTVREATLLEYMRSTLPSSHTAFREFIALRASLALAQSQAAELRAALDWAKGQFGSPPFSTGGRISWDFRMDEIDKALASTGAEVAEAVRAAVAVREAELKAVADMTAAHNAGEDRTAAWKKDMPNRDRLRRAFDATVDALLTKHPNWRER